MKNSICILIPFFGEKFPKYFPHFLKSTSWNMNVDFKFFTDIKESFLEVHQLNENIELIDFSLREFNKLASLKIGIPINVKDPYKLCDFKPAYGLIFEDFIQGYDFWGHSDIDVIYGRIRKFITDDRLEQNDIISTRKEYLSGFFALYRNKAKVNYLFKKSEDWNLVFASQKHLCFDECNFHHMECFDGIPISQINSEIDSMTHVISREQKTINSSFETICHEFLKIGLDETKYLDELEVSRKGVLSKKNNKEYVLVHLRNIKYHDFFQYGDFDYKEKVIHLDGFGISHLKNSIENRKERLFGMELALDKEKWIFLNQDKLLYLSNRITGFNYLLKDLDRLISVFDDKNFTGNEFLELISKSELFEKKNKEQIRNITLNIITKAIILRCLKILDLNQYKAGLETERPYSN